MAFKLIKEPTFTTDAPISVPTDNGFIEQSVRVKFKMLPPEDEELDVDAFLARAVVWLEGVIDEDNAPITSSPELIASIIAMPFMRTALMRAYWTALSGAKLGN